MVSYKGFRCHCIAHFSIQPEIHNPVLGFKAGRYHVEDDKIKDELGFVGDVLNIADNRTKKQGFS